MKALVMAVCLIVGSVAAEAQGLATLADVRKITDDAMAKVGKGDIDGGLKTFKHLTIIPSVEFDAMAGQAVLQMPAMASRFGASIGSEFIREDRLGDSLAKFIYINRFEKHAMRWMFFLYKGKDGWVVNTFRFDDRWVDLL